MTPIHQSTEKTPTLKQLGKAETAHAINPTPGTDTTRREQLEGAKGLDHTSRTLACSAATQVPGSQIT